MKRRVGIALFVIACSVFTRVESLQQSGETRMRRRPSKDKELEASRKSVLLECTEALDSWSHFAKMSVKKLLDDEYEKKEYIFFIGTLVPQIETIDKSLSSCKDELFKYGILAEKATSQLELDLRSKGEKEMVINDNKSATKALKRIKELHERNQLINEAEKLISGFDSRDVCTECRLFSSQIALISVLKRLRLMYNSYIVELEDKIDPNMLEDM